MISRRKARKETAASAISVRSQPRQRTEAQGAQGNGGFGDGAGGGESKQRLSGRQFARMGKVTPGERAHLAREQGDNGYRLTGQRHEFHFIAFAAFVDMHNRADVTRLRPFVRNVRGQYNAIVLFNHSFAASEGFRGLC
jgi:hypothetical protein